MEGFFGIIGGLGPKATTSFVSDIVKQTVAENDQDHLDFLLINHATVPDRTAYILDHSKPNPLPYLLKDVKKLTEANVSFIVIPCNTANYFIDTLQASTSIPIVNMISETATYIKNEYPNVLKVGIMATEGTIKANLYQEELVKAGLEPVLPTENIQKVITNIIYQQVKQGNEVDHNAYIDVLQSMYDLQCDSIILGCTELSFIEHEVPYHDFHIVDAQAVLVERTIQLAGKQVQKPHSHHYKIEQKVKWG